MTVGQRIKVRREELQLSQTELAKKLGYKSRSSINKIELGSRDLTQSKIKAIADALDTTPSYIMGWDEPEQDDIEDLSKYGVMPIKKIRLPMLGEIACGEPRFADEQHEEYIEVDEDYHADFCLRAKGDSMINASIDHGDVVLLQTTSMVNNGEIAAVIINDEATLKRVYYYQEQGKLILQAENPDYEPLVYINEELNTIRIIGKIVAVIKKL